MRKCLTINAGRFTVTMRRLKGFILSTLGRAPTTPAEHSRRYRCPYCKYKGRTSRKTLAFPKIWCPMCHRDFIAPLKKKSEEAR